MIDFYIYILRLVEHIWVNNQSRVKSADLYQWYLDWCKKEDVKIVAKSNKFGAAIHRLFGSENKQHHVQGKPIYFYENIQFIDEVKRQDFCQRVNFPDHVTVQLDNEMMIMFFPTTIYMDKDLIEYKVVYNLSTQSFRVYVRGDIELDRGAYGLSEYADFDQLFVDGMDTFIRSLVLCKGKNVTISDDSVSGVPEKHAMGYLGQDGTEINSVDRWFSRNCCGVMPFLHEHRNNTCAKCNRDLNRLDENKKETESHIEVMDITKTASSSDTSGDLNTSAEPMQSSDNNHSLDDVDVSILTFK